MAQHSRKPRKKSEVVWVKKYLCPPSFGSQHYEFINVDGLEEPHKSQLEQILRYGRVIVEQQMHRPTTDLFGPEPRHTESRDPQVGGFTKQQRQQGAETPLNPNGMAGTSGGTPATPCANPAASNVTGTVPQNGQRGPTRNQTKRTQPARPTVPVNRSGVFAIPKTVPVSGSGNSATPKTVPINGSGVSATPKTVPVSGSGNSATPKTVPINGSGVSATPKTVPVSGSGNSAIPKTVPINGSGVSATPKTVPVSGSGNSAIPKTVPVNGFENNAAAFSAQPSSAIPSTPWGRSDGKSFASAVASNLCKDQPKPPRTRNLKAASSGSGSSLHKTEQDGRSCEKSMTVFRGMLQSFQPHPKPRPEPRGIKNTSNDCFIIAVLQFLFANPYMAGFMTYLNKSLDSCQDIIKSVKVDAPVLMAMWMQWKTYVDKGNATKDGKLPPLRDVILRDILPKLNSVDIQAGMQCDSNEFCLLLFEKMQKELNKLRSTEPESVPEPPAVDADDLAEGWQQVKNWRKTGRRQRYVDITCPLSKIFCVKIVNQIFRLNAEGKPCPAPEKTDFDRLTHLYLTSQPDHIASVEDALDNYFQCSFSQDATTSKAVKVSLVDAPLNLFMFIDNAEESYNGFVSTVKKTQKNLQLDLTLRLKPSWMYGNSTEIINSCVFELSSGMFHRGVTTVNGHYMSFHRDENGHVFVFDDQKWMMWSPSQLKNYQQTFQNETVVVTSLIYTRRPTGRQLAGT